MTAIHSIDILFSQPVIHRLPHITTTTSRPPPHTTHHTMSMFAVLADDYTNEVQNTPQKTRTAEPTMLDRVTASNSFELTPGHVGMFLGARHKYVIQAREHIQTETKLRLHHSVSEDGVVAFHFRGAIHKKNLLRLAYRTLFNTLGKRSIETGFGVACDSSVVKFVLGKQQTNILRLIQEAGGDENIRARYYKDEEMIGLQLQKSSMTYEKLLSFLEVFENAVEDEALRFQHTYIRDRVSGVPSEAMASPTFSMGDHSWPSTPSSEATTDPYDASPAPSEAASSEASTVRTTRSNSW